jgi:riboflavin kinase/FMN adenylyltransferase
MAQAEKLDLPSIVMTFEPSPQEYFGGPHAPPRLSDWRDRYTRIRRAGIDAMYLLPFNKAIANLPPTDFVDQHLCQRLNARLVCIGDDFRFGRNREGNFNLLQQMASEGDFEVLRLGTVMLEGSRISSSAIREALQDGDLSVAEQLLDRKFSMSGRVVRGRQLGRTLGFPTINLRPRQMPPLSGVFAVSVELADGRWKNGVASLGVRPTVGAGEPLLEVFLFDFDGDLYGQRVSVEFIQKLRNEERFSSVELMVDQMKLDVKAAREALVRQER